jgi:CBS domain-containing protein
MPINECCTTTVVTCGTDASVPEVAELMRRHHVGAILVTAGQDADRVPVGIITDRDIVLETVALQLDVPIFTAGDIMSTPVISVRESEGIIEALRLMRSSNIRRLPVVTEAGTLYGIVSSDDLLKLLAAELSLMTGAIVDQREAETRLRRSPYPESGAQPVPGATQH